MKKLIISLIMFFMLNLVAINTVIASTTIDTKLNSNIKELNKGDQVVVTLKLDNFKEMHKGINVYKATLEYDKNIFESVIQSDFECQNNWEDLKYNPSNGEFIIIKKVGSTKKEDIVKITLKVKINIEPSKATVKIKNIVTSEGKSDVILKDTQTTLNIVEEQQTIPTIPSNIENLNNNKTLSQNLEPSKNASDAIIDDLTNTNKSQNITNNNKSEKTKKTIKTHNWMFVLLFIEIIVCFAIILYLRRKFLLENLKNNKNKKYMILLIAGIMFIEFVGITGVFAYNFANKGELNGDSKINYADVSLLSLHLIDLKELPDDKLENADMNNDGKITVTDLSILIQKLENSLSYDVTISNLKIENYYPDKSQEIKVKINALVSYGASIEKLVINDEEYEVEKIPNTTSEYIITLNVGQTPGLKTYKITEALLNNNKRTEINYKISVDVLKEMPNISNYRVVEDIDNSKLIILFDVLDEDDSIKSSTIKIQNEDKVIVKTEKLKKGSNRIEFEVEDKKEYKAYIELKYDLDSNKLENDIQHVGIQSYEKDLQLIVDYNLTVSNIKTYKNDSQTKTFDNGDQVKIVFESTNSTKHIPSSIKVDGKEYEVTQENNKYTAILDPLDTLGSKTINIEEVILSNGKKFKLAGHNSVTIDVIKRMPNITDFSTTEFTETNNLKVMFDLDDKDNAIIELSIILMDAESNEIDRTKLTSAQLKDKENSAVNKFLNTRMTNKYKVKIITSYNLTGKDEDNIIDSIALEKEVTADPRVEINSIVPNKYYIEKGEILKLTYDLESNIDEDITRILVNNTNCIAVKLDNGNYEVALKVGNESGIYPLTTTKLYYSDEKVATIDNTINVDILKDKPSIENFTQTDNVDENKVILNFDVKDDENSFINGKAVLTLDGISVEKNITKGHNELSFNVEPSKSYTLEIKSTYDTDSNSLSTKPDEDNRVIDGIIDTKNIELIADYELNIENIKTYNEQGETKYFSKSEPIKINFVSSNITNFDPVKAIINGNEYELTKIDNSYHLTIDSHKTSGVKTATIEKIILSNSRGIIINKNNKIDVTVLKDKPVVGKFGYKENIDGTISATFNVEDLEQTITAGKVVVINRGTIIKEQALSANQNTISFVPTESESYTLKVIADYDLDMNILEENANEYKNVTLLEADITSGNRMFEVKDIIRTLLYRQTENGVEEVQNLKESDLSNLNDYIIKVRTKAMPTFYTTISGYRIEGNKLKLTLDYDNVVQYTNNKKQDKLEIVYGDITSGTATNISLESLIREMELNPTGTFTLDRDYDASIITNNANSLITSTFMGTLNGNGHKIYNLNKPLFNDIESATIKNITFESPELSDVNSRGAIANIATNSTIENVHIKNLILTTGNNMTAGMIGEATNVTVEQSSVTNFTITTSKHIRVSAIIGQMDGGSIRNCYVSGKINSTQTKDGNGIGGVLGHGLGTSPITVENCIAKINHTSNVSPRLNGGIVGILSVKDSILRNNVSLSTGTGFYSVHGDQSNITIANNYELLNSGLTSNASSNKVKQISQEEITSQFFKESANFDENIWDLSTVSYENPPVLKSSKQNDDTTTNDKLPSNNKLYIPDYSRIKNVKGYTKSKDVLYHNINKLMPYYDAKYLIEDGLKFQDDSELNTKIIKHVLPYSSGKLLTYLTSQNYNSITSIKVVFDDYTTKEYNVIFKELKQNISIYQIENLNIDYAYNNYVIKDDSGIVKTIADYISGLDYTTTLDPLTTAADSRLYRDHYNEVMKPLAQTIALQLLQNDADIALTINNEILNNRIKQQLIDSGRLNKLLYGYNYYHRWYQFEIGGSKVSDILLFEGKMYKDTATLDNLINETLVGNLATNNTAGFYINNLNKYTGSSKLSDFLDSIIINIGGYEDVNDWFTEFFSEIGVLSEIPVESHPEVKYRAWDRLKGFQNFILPLSTLPKYAGYIISGPAQFQVGAQRVYVKDPTTKSGQDTIKNIVNAHSRLVKRQFETLAGTFHVQTWNNFTIMIYDTCKTITGYKTSYLPGTNIPIGTSPVTTINRVGTNEPFHKNFNEAIGAWQYGSAGGVGSTAGFLWFIATPGLTNYDTWTHEFQHALCDKIMMFRNGLRFRLENYTQGNVEQRESWSNNNISGYDVGPYYFNLAFTLNKESFATQNLTPERINTREKLENYFKGQFDALELLDYVSAKAFIQLTPEQQAKIATKMSQSSGWSSWGTITEEQAKTMNLTSLESLWDNGIMLRPNNAWGVSIRGLNPINGVGVDDYGYESIWVTRWYMGHNDNGSSDSFTNKKNMFEMLGYAGIDGYVTYGSRRSSSDLDAIRKITLAKTGTAMNWKEYRMSRYAEIESKLDNKYVNTDLMIKQFVQALQTDANNGNRNITAATNLRKIYYHYLKRVTNDFIDDPLGTNLETIHIKTAEELVDKINKQPYGYYILDNDIDFSNMTTNITQTFMGKLDGNNHKIIGNTKPIFQKIRYGSVTNLILENTNIPRNISNVGALSVRTEYSILENISAKDIQLNFGGRNDVSLIGGSINTTVYQNLKAEPLKNSISSIEDINKLIQDPGGVFVVENDIDFTDYTGTGSVINVVFNGTIDGKGHTFSNLKNLSLFSNFNGTVENLNIKDFSNISTNNFTAAFAQNTNNAKLKNMKFERITLSGANNVAVVSSLDKSNSTFENISVKNANVTGTGVYVSTFIGRKYSGSIKNVFVQGVLEITTTENGGIVGAIQEGGTIENIVSKVNIFKSENTYNRVPNDKDRNGGIVGNIYDSPKIKNSISLGRMEGYIDTDGIEKLPYKVVGAVTNIIKTTIENCYEYADEQGFSSITEETSNNLKEATETQIHTVSFYKDILNFDENIWNLEIINDNGYPELK